MASSSTTSINLPTEEFINETFDFSVSFDNTGTSEGYGPFFDLVVPKGITLGTASYLGAALSVVTYTRTATGWIDGSGAAVTAHPYGSGLTLPTGAVGDKWNLVQLPFGSFVADQPAAEIEFLGNILSKANGAQVGTGLNLSSRGGFRYGNDALDNAAGDPPIQQSGTTAKTITPKVLELTKDSDAPEEETATGENFARTYTLTLNVANGEKVDNLQVKDFLPNNLVYLPGTLSISGATATSIELPTAGAAQNAPNNDFVLNLGSVTGTTSESDVVITYKAYAPKLDANTASVIDPASGDDHIALNESQVTGTYGGVAVSDGTKDAVGTKDDPADYTLDLKSIAIQKAVAVVGGGIAKPGAVLEYTLNFQISDYFSFKDININDLFSDGQRFDSSFAPTLIISGNNGTTGTTTFSNFSGNVNGGFTSDNLTGNVATGTDGSTALNFNVSQRLINSSVDADGILVGDLVDNLKQTGTTATLVYRTVIQDNFSNQQNLPGYTQDSSVDLADVLTNNVTINGKVVGSDQLEEDTSKASIAIPEPTASKEIYAINGVVVSDPALAKVAPGQTVTYRLKVELPIADTEKLKLTDYLPLPVFNATQVTGSIGAFSGVPAAGTLTFGPSHTLNSILPGVTPTFTTNGTQNTIAINFGSFDDSQNRAATIDLLFTVTASDKPFADRLFLTNQAGVEYGSTDDAFKAAVTEIVQVELLQPTLKLTKGVVSTNATSPTFDKTVGPVTFAAPGTAGGAFTGTITSAGLKTTPVDANLSGVDAGDLVRFAIVVENTGGSGAFDAAIKDILPAGLSNPQNLRITDGAGNVLTYTGDLFGAAGLTLTDDADGALDKGRTGNTATTNGKNIIVITYDATVDSTVNPKQTLTSGAELLQFAGVEGGTDYTANATNVNWVNTASTTAATPKVTLNLVGTEINGTNNSNTQAVIGELVEYELVLTVPEGTTPSSTLVNTLPAGLSLADFTGLTVSPGLSSSAVTNLSTLAANTIFSGSNFTVNLGTLTNSNSSNAAPETITLRFRAVVSNLASNQNNTGLNHVASNVKFNWNNGSAQSVTATEADNVSNNVTVVEPDVNIVKDVVVNGSGNLGDAGDPLEYTITISHGATNPDAFDLTFQDVLSSKIGNATITSVTDSAGTLNASNFEIAGSTLQLKSGVDVDLVGSRTITIKVSGNLSAAVTPNETINTPAKITWSSLNGTVTNRSIVASIVNDDERTGTGGVNDYTKSDDAPIIVANVEPIKSIVSTSETATNNKTLDASGRIIGDDVAIGEIVRYRLVTRLSEGQIDNLQIKDNLPVGLRFIDGTAKVGLVNTDTNNLSTTDSGLSGSIVANIANPDTFIPSFALPDANVSASDSADNDTYASGTDIFFKFGNITNTGTNAGSEYVVIEFDALVLDEAGNTAAKTLANNFDVSIGGTKVNTSTDATVKVVAPQLSITQALTVNGGTTGDAGDLATITLTVSNTGTADAFEVKLEDVLDATKFDLTNAASVSLPAGFSFDKNTPGKIVYSAGSIAKGATETFTFTVPLKTAVNAGETLVSQAKITEATTINGTPISGVERDIANPDILANDQQLTINKPLLATELVGTQLNNTSNSNTEAVIGEIVTYRTTITVPEGTTAAAVLKDTLDPGLAFVGFTRITSSSGVTASNITNVSDLNTKATLGANGADFTLNLGNLVNSNNTNGTPETIVIEYQAVVLNTAANQSTAKESGPQLNNAATLNWTGNATPLSAAAANVTVIEPLLQVIKDVTLDGAGNTGNGGDEVVYTITIKHTSNSESDAYDVNLSDVLPAEFVSGTGAIEIVSNTTGSTLGNNDFQIAGGTAATGGTAGGTLQLVSGKTLNVPEGTQLVLKVTGKVSDQALLGQTFDSPAQITWTSLAGTQSNLSTYTATGDEERTGTGTLNNYFAQDNAPATIENLTNVTKVLATTSVGNDANKTVTVGEILTYTVTIAVPEGTTPNLKLLDTLDPGLAFVEVVSITPSAGVTSSAGSFAPSMGIISNVSSADIDKGRVLTANLGNVKNSNSSENTLETIAITYRAVVLNANLVNDGTTHDNSAVVSWTAAGTPQSLTVKAGAVTVSEPKLALDVQVLDDNGNPAENVRGNIGDTITVRVTVSSNGSDAFEANAFDLAFSNSLPAGMTFVPGSITLVSGATSTNFGFSGGNVNVGYNSFTDGTTSVFTFQVTLDGTVTTGDITNSGQLRYTSIAGNVGTITPNNPFAGERTGDTALIGGTANDLRETNTASVTLNLPPTTLNGSDRVASEDTIQIPGLGGSDPNAGGTVDKYKIDTLPAVGTLYLGNPQNGGTAMTIGQEISANQVGNLFYTAPAGFTGTTFTYSAIDNEAFQDPTPATVTLSPNTPPETVNAIDRVEPLGTVNLEGLNGSDTDGTVANYEITSLPPIGTLYLGDPKNGGTLVIVGQLIPPDKIDELFFSAPNGFTGTTFTYAAVDNDGGKDKTPATVTINANQPPETQNAKNDVPPGETIQVAGLGGSDPTPGGNVANYKIDTLPATGTLYLGNPANGGTLVTVGQLIPPDKIDELFFSAPNNFTGTSFTYHSIDNEGAADLTPATVLLGPNQPPETVNAIDRVEPLGTVNLEGLNGSDTDGTVANYEITSLPPVGSLYLGDPKNGGTLVTIGQLIPPDKIDELFFSAPNGFTGTSFTYKSIDNLGLGDRTPATVTIDVNLPPTTLNGSDRVASEDTVQIPGLGGSDPTAGGSVANYLIDTLPTVGTLYLGNPANGGTAVTISQVISPANISNLFYTAPAGFTGTNFTYHSIDNEGAADLSPAIVTLSPNTPPETVNAIDRVEPLGTVNLEGLNGSDTDGTVANYEITSLPPVGSLYLGDPKNGGTLVTVGQLIPPDKIDELFFSAPNGFTGTTFTYAAVDNDGGKDKTPATVTIQSNQPPETQNALQNIPLNATTKITGLTNPLGGSDADGTVAKYKITSLPDPIDGELYLGNPNNGGTTVTLNQEIPVNQIGNLYFKSTGTFNGSSFTYASVDNDGTVDATPAVVTLNAPPETVDGNYTAAPNATISLPGLGGSDPDSIVAFYTIKSLPTGGVLYLGSAIPANAITVGKTLTPAEISQLVFKADGTFNGSTSFTYAATDNYGLPDVTPATVTIVSPNGNLPPSTVNGSQTVEPGTAAILAGLSGSDADGTVTKYRIDTLPDVVDGVLYLGSANPGNAVTVGQEIPAGQIGNLVFVANPGFNGGSFTYRAIDDDNTPDPTPATFTLNTPPTTIDSIGKVNPNNTLQIPGLGGNDADGTVINYTIETLPPAAQGTLYLGNPASGGTTVTVGQILPAAQIGNLFFQATGTFTGTTFTYSATDNLGAKDTTPATVNLTPDGVNIAPTTVNVEETVIPGTTVNLTELTGSDADGTVQKYRIDTLPDAADGVLSLGGNAVTPGQEIPANQIGNLTFVATPGFNGGSFTYRSIDNNNESDPTPATVTLNVPPETPSGSQSVSPNTSVLLTVPTGSDADGTVAQYRIDTLPDVADGVLYLENPNLGNAVTAGQVLTPAQLSQLVFQATPGFNGGNFTYSSIDNTGTPDPTPGTFVLNVPPETVNAVGKVDPSNTLNLTGLGGSDIDGTVASYTLNTLPANTQGILYLGNPVSGGTVVTPGQVIPANQIGNLFFVASGSFTGTSFTYSATDNNGGVDATPATVTLAPEGVNIVPTTANVRETVVPGTTVNLTELTGSDADGTVEKYRIDTLPDAADGVLYLGGNAVTPGQEISANEIGNLTFVATPGFNGGSFTYRSIDNTGTPDPTPATVTLNTPPQTLDGSKTVNPNTRVTLSGMGGSDADGTVVNYRIDILPPASQGVLYLGANAIAPGQVLTPTQLSQLAFQATGNFTGSTFDYTAIDNTGTPDPTPATYTLSPGNIAPNTDNAINKVNPTETVNLTGLGGSDSDGTVAYYTITSLPPGTQGTLYLGNPAVNNPVKVGDILTPDQIQQLSFQASAGFTGTTFTYKATDDDGATDATPATVTLSPDNLPPNTIDRTQEVTENTTTPLTGLGGNDPDGTISFYTIESLPSQGTLYLGDPANGGTTVSIGQTLTPFEIGQLYFQSPVGYTGSNFNYTATDNNGAQDSTPATVFLPVPGGNLPPETNLATGEVIPGNTWQITGLGGSDPNSDPIAQYQITTLPNPADGELYLGNPDNGGVKVNLNDQILANQIDNLYFKSTGTFDGATFTYAAIDPSNAQDPTPATVTISPLGNNQPPDTDDVTATTHPGGSISLIDLDGSDPDGTVALYKIDTLPPTNQGKLYLDDPVQGKIPVAEGQILTPNQLKLLTFEASGGFTGTSFTYSAIDNDGATDTTPATVTITSNLPQTQTNLPPQTQNANQTIVPGDTNPLIGLSGSDSDGTVALYQITTLPSGGTLYIGDPANGGILVTKDTILTPTQLQNLVFDAQPGFNGTTFTYAAIDNDGAKDTTPATVTLTAGNAPPQTQDAIVPVSPNSSVSLASQVVATDPDGNVKTYTILTLPGDGQLFLNGNPVKAGDKLTPAQLSSLMFSAGSTFTHTSFTYTATDEDGDSDRTPATIYLKAPGSNLPPVAPDTTIPISPGTTIDLPDFQATDPDGTIKTYTIDTLPAGGKLYVGNPASGGIRVTVGMELTGDQIKQLFFQADSTFGGSSFTYTATDDSGDSDPGTVTLTIGNLPPTTQPVTTNFKPGETRLLTGLGGSDPDGLIAYYTITSVPSGGTLYLGNPSDGIHIKSGDVLTPDQIKLLVFQSGSNFTGTSFTYTATDNLGLTDPTPATVTIGKLGNPAPELTPAPTPEPAPEPTPAPTLEPTPGVLVSNNNSEVEKCQECCPVAPTIGGLEIAPPKPIEGTDVVPPTEPDSSRFSRTNSSDDDDEVRGNDDRDQIWGDRGNDTISGKDGDDRLAGDSQDLNDAEASGEDRIYGGAGNDELNGNEKSDTLSGGIGNDIEHGGKDGDLISGDLGNDTLGGDLGDDTILGSLGRFAGVGSQEERDELYGNQGRDLLKGGEGDDTVHGGQDHDFAYGGKDNDEIYGELGNDTLAGDQGDDTLQGGTENPANPDTEGQDSIDGAVGRDVIFGNEKEDILRGGDGDDRIHGGKDGDFMSGDMGNDTLYGERGNDTILGSLGRSASVGKTEERDLLSGNDGNDIIKGGEGDDSIYGGKNNDLIYAGKDHDMVFGDHGSDTLVGDQGNDTISGGNGKPNDPEDANGHDVIFGGDGEDVLDGNLGNDSIITGSGNDHAMGGRGDDILWGEAGNDLLFGDLGNDTLCGGDGDDILVGSNGDPGNTGDGNDRLCGGAGNDRLYGNEGDDTLNGGGDDDCLFGGQGNDLLKGGTGNDQLFGEEGNDTLIGGDGNDVFVLRQGSGTDTVEDFKLGEDRIGLVGLTFENLRISQGTTGAEIRANGELLAILLGVSATALTPASFTTELRCAVATKTEDCGCPTVPTIDGLAIEPLVDVDLDLQIQAQRDIGGDDIDILQGSIQTDRFDGRDSADRLSGNLGNDELYGNRGNDSISGGNGDDRAHGGQDGDLISGALGNDTLVGDRGNDTLLGSLGSFNGIGRSGERDLLSGNDGNDIIKGGEGEDSIYAGKDNDLVYAGKDNDLVFGDWGSDTLIGDDGDDTLVGGNGDPNVPESANSNDLIFGGAGNDSLNGNEGNDSLVGGVGDDESRGGKGNDVIWGEAGNDLIFGELGSDTLCGGDGDDTLVGSNGNPGNTGDSSDKLCGGAGNDVLYGNEGDDRLDGDSGDDTLLGGQQNDTLSGGAGNDFLAGEQGKNLLIGGEGSDVFEIITGGVDTIVDFQVGVDRLLFSSSVTADQLTLTQVNNSTVINFGTEQLAILEGVKIDRLSEVI